MRPEADLTASSPEAYALLERHIDLHRYVMSLEQKRGIAYHEAVTDWYDQVYSPVVQVIREQRGLEDFPGRTETDLYLAVSGYRVLTEEVLDWEFEGGAAAPGQQDVLRRLTDRILRREREAVQSCGRVTGAARWSLTGNRRSGLRTSGCSLPSWCRSTARSAAGARWSRRS